MEDLHGKKLLILGGQQKMIDIVQRAKELGIYTVVTDWYDNSPAKTLANKSLNISISDVEVILDLIKEERVDGVFTGFIDSYLPHYLEICRRAGLPCYLNDEMLACSTDKQHFKKICHEIGIATIPSVDVRNLKEIRYPVVIKPIDNSGSKGITICNNEGMVSAALERAKKFSKSKRYLAEEFMACDYVAAYYTVKHGHARLSLLMDKDTNRIGRGKAPYPVAYIAPSRYHALYLEKADPLVKRLVRRLHMNEGTFIISFFVNGSNFYTVEFGARLTATREYVITGEDILGMHIRHALTGRFETDVSQSKPNDCGIYCMMLHFINEGTIGRIEGFEKVKKMDGLLDVLQYRDLDANIRADGSYGQLFCRVYLKADNPDEMIQRVENVQKCLSVTSTDGRPMLFTEFDVRSFFRN